jgi:histone H3/H4
MSIFRCACGANEIVHDFDDANVAVFAEETTSGDDSDPCTDDSDSDDSKVIDYDRVLKMITAEEKDWKPVVSRQAFEVLLEEISNKSTDYKMKRFSSIAYALWEAFMVELLNTTQQFAAHASRKVMDASDVTAALNIRWGISLP